MTDILHRLLTRQGLKFLANSSSPLKRTEEKMKIDFESIAMDFLKKP